MRAAGRLCAALAARASSGGGMSALAESSAGPGAPAGARWQQWLHSRAVAAVAQPALADSTGSDLEEHQQQQHAVPPDRQQQEQQKEQQRGSRGEGSGTVPLSGPSLSDILARSTRRDGPAAASTAQAAAAVADGLEPALQAGPIITEDEAAYVTPLHKLKRGPGRPPRQQHPGRGGEPPGRGPRRPRQAAQAGTSADGPAVAASPRRQQQKQQGQAERAAQQGPSGGRPRFWRVAPIKDYGRGHPLVPVIMHHTETCEEVLELVQRYRAAGNEVTPREMTAAFQQAAYSFSAAFKEQQEQQRPMRGRHQGPQEHDALAGEAQQQQQQQQQEGELGGEQQQGQRQQQPAAPDQLEAEKRHAAALFSLALPSLRDMDCQAVATALWMCARLHHLPPPEEREGWEAAAEAMVGRFKTVEISNLFFSLGVLQWNPEDISILDELIDRALAGRGREQLTPWAACNVLWGSARLSSAPSGYQPSADRLLALLEAALPQLDCFQPQSFTSLLYALACLRARPDDEALVAILGALQLHAGRCSARQLVTIVWSLGALRAGHLISEPLWTDLELALVEKPASSLPYNATPHFLFGSARLGIAPANEVIELLAGHAMRAGRRDLHTGDTATILRALARMGYSAGEFSVSHEFVEDMLRRFLDISRQRCPSLRQLCSLLSGLASLGYQPAPQALASLVDLSGSLIGSDPEGSLSSRDVRILQQSFEQLGCEEGLRLLQRHGGASDHGAGGSVDLEEDEVELEVQPEL